MDDRENLTLERLAAQLAIALTRIERLERQVAELEQRQVVQGERIAAANEKADFALGDDGADDPDHAEVDPWADGQREDPA